MLRILLAKHRNRLQDVGCISLIVLLAALVFLVRNSAVPMQIWDESRHANNALEMSSTGLSLVTRFHGVADHWSTKPPLLIWLMAVCLRIGLPPLLAIRLPSITAATCSVLLVFFFARIRLRDRLAGLFSALILLASPLFVGWHTGRTGDYDSLIILFTLAYSLAFWRYIESRGRPAAKWMVIAGVALALGTLTKGVGGALALPALLLYAMVRRRLGVLLRDPCAWLTLLGVALVIGSYYTLRERADPGYLAAVWRNEFTGRYLTVTEGHAGGPLFYFRVLAGKFEPGFMMLPLVCCTFFRRERRRRSVTLLCLFVAGILLAVVTTSETKIFWYVAPATPFLALAVGVGLSNGLAWLRQREREHRAPVQPRLAYLAVAAIFATANLGAIYYYQFGVEKKLSSAYMGGRYGPFLEEIRNSNLTRNLILLDEGSSEALIDNQNGDFEHYNPEADFFAKVEDGQGMRVRVVVPSIDLPSGTWVATCDPRAHRWLTAHYQVAVALQSRPWCTFEQTRGPIMTSLSQYLPPCALPADPECGDGLVGARGHHDR